MNVKPHAFYKNDSAVAATVGVAATVVLTLMAVSLASGPSQAITGLAVGIVAVALSVILITVSSGEFKPLSLIAVFIYCHAVLFVARPAFAIAYQSAANIFTASAYDSSFVLAQVIAACGLLSLVLGYCLAVGQRASSTLKIEPFSTPQWLRLAPVIWTIVLVGFALYLLYILQSGWGPYWASVFSGRSDENRAATQASSAYLYAGVRFATGALLLIFMQALLARRNGAAVFSLSVLLVASVPSFFSGNRSDFIPVLVAVLLITFCARPEWARIRYAIVGLPLFFVVFLIAPRLWRDQLATGGSIIASIKDATSSREVFESFLGGLDTAMIDAFSVQVLAQTSNNLMPAEGSTYLAALGSAVPRAIWSNKPETVDEVLNAALFPATDAKGIGFAFGVYSEPFFNFGLGGVLFLFCAMGVVFGLLTRAYMQTSRPATAFIYIMVAAHLFPIVRGSLTFSSQRLWIPLIPVILALVFTFGVRVFQDERNS